MSVPAPEPPDRVDFALVALSGAAIAVTIVGFLLVLRVSGKRR